MKDKVLIMEKMAVKERKVLDMAQVPETAFVKGADLNQTYGTDKFIPGHTYRVTWDKALGAWRIE